MSSLLFMFGNTGSGKTYTMQVGLPAISPSEPTSPPLPPSPQGNDSEGGVVNHTLDVLFNSIKDFRARWFSFSIDAKTNAVAFRVSRRNASHPFELTSCPPAPLL